MPRLLDRELIATLDHWFDETDLVSPSISYALFDRDGVIYQNAVGEFQRDGRPPRLDTIYRIASMSKSFEVAAALVLVERGLLALDSPVSGLVPEFVDPVDEFGVAMPVTVQMLMSNSSALPEDNGWADYELGLSRRDFLAVISAGLEFAGRPGDGFQYSNIGFWLLGVIVENVTGQAFVEFATETLLVPLSLTDTRYDAAEYLDDEDRLAHGFGTFDDGATWFDRPFVGTGIGGCAASMFSTVTDIARWSAWLSSAFDPAYGDDAILSRQSRRLMQRIHTATPAGVDRSGEQQLEGIGYGLGLFVENDVRFGLVAQHSGGLPGWSSNMRWQLSTGMGAVVFANTNGVRPGIQATAMLRALLQSEQTPAREISPWPTTLAAAELIDSALRGSGDVDDLDDSLLSPNLLSDVPADVRVARVQKAIDEVGGLAASIPPLAERTSWTASPAHLAWIIPGASGAIECRIELTPTTPALVQRLEVSVATEITAASSVTRHYLPVPRPGGTAVS